MALLKKRLRLVAMILKGVLFGSLLDPIEVFYDRKRNEVYPIVSKSGNTTVKIILIKEYRPDFDKGFPEVHHVDPFELTGVVERFFFKKYSAYKAFCKGKNVVIVFRDPYERFVSLHIDLIKEKNILYKYPLGLHVLLKRQDLLSWSDLLNLIRWIPDRFADRHFRSQSYFCKGGLVEATLSVKIIELSKFVNLWRESKLEGNVHANRNKSDKTEKNEAVTKLRSSKKYHLRYKEDVAIYRELKPLKFLQL